MKDAFESISAHITMAARTKKEGKNELRFLSDHIEKRKFAAVLIEKWSAATAIA